MNTNALQETDLPCRNLSTWQRLRVTVATIAISIAVIACTSGDQDETAVTTTEQRPNVLLIVADDMGYNDLSSWGSEINTPNLDELALNGLRFTNFHAAPVCAPARAMLMSGTSNHQAGLGSMTIKRSYDGGTDPNPNAIGFGLPTYAGYLSERIAALPEILQADGYHTYMAGKWDLGRALDAANMPAGRGFESSFILTTGSAIHLGTTDQDASGGIGRADPHPYQENGRSITSLPDDFFSTETYTNKIIEYIDDNQDDGQPFFAWLAYTAPHWPLQLPADWLERYADRYDDGYDAARQQRFNSAKELGIFASDVDLSSYQPSAPDWASLFEIERRSQSRAMEIYAGMVANMDYHVGRLVAYLEDSGQLENTVILFLSDNGADASGVPAVSATYPVDNSVENVGEVNSWISYGPGWAEAATAPFRGTKSSMAEGGTRVAAFLNHHTVDAPGSLDRGYLTYMDIAPTILEITGSAEPSGRFQGRDVLPMTGSSFWARVGGDDRPVHSASEAIGSELHGDRALVRGDWKILMDGGSEQWELFNFAEDIGENNNLAEERPELLTELIGEWQQFASEHGVVY